MALLSNEKRQQYFDFLGLGNVNKTNIKKFQKTALGGKMRTESMASRPTSLSVTGGT